MSKKIVEPTATPGSTATLAAPTTTAPAPSPTKTATKASNRNALADITAQLNSYGLGSLAGWAWGEIVNGRSEAEVLTDIYKTPQFKQRFPAIFTRQAQGLPAISPGDYVSYENTASQIMRDAGLPAGFWDKPSDFTDLIARDVSANELQQRVQLAQQAMYQSSPETKAVLARDYGITDGDITAHWLDPTQAEPVLQQKFLAAQIGGAADTTGYGSSKSMDDYLASLGVTQQQAQSGFTDLGEKSQLFEGLPGEGTAGIGQKTQVAAEFGGNAQAQQAIARRAQQREAAFGAGGSFQSSAGGFGGIGKQGTQ